MPVKKMAEVNGQDVSVARTLTILGCGMTETLELSDFNADEHNAGTLGSAILYGLLTGSAREKLQDGVSNGQVNGHKPSIPKGEEGLSRPTHYVACVRTQRSVARLKHGLAAQFQSPIPVRISQGDNVSAVNAASTIILGCQPQDLEMCLKEEGLVHALQGKLIISILAGITIPQLESHINEAPFVERSSSTTIIRAMPNTCALHNASTTLLTVSPEHRPPPHALALTNTLLSSIGGVHPITPAQMDPCTALCGSTPAFFARIIDGLLDGAVSLGLKRSEAKYLVAETMKGVAEGLMKGQDTGEVVETVCTPGGSSIQGILVLERNGMKGLLADALRAAAGANGTLGRQRGAEV